MASKASQPALYEMIRARSGPISSSAPAEPRHDHGGGSEIVRPLWLAPGHSIRLPAGYLILGCGLAVILLASSYMIGHKRGYGAAKTEIDQQIISAVSLGAVDPLTSGQPVVESPKSGAGASNAAEAGTNAGSGPVSPSGWKPVIPPRDPRQKGLNYFILAETTENGAKQLAEFCRANGLETYVVSGKNDRSRRVVAFPGFPASARSSQSVKALEAQIHSVGDKWKKNKGSSDLHDAYPSLYPG